jgi:hypothetical protein
MAGKYAVRSVSLQYRRQLFEVGIYQSSQNLLSLICVYEGILDSFLELADCISECVPISKTNLIQKHPVFTGNLTGALIKCYADTAIRVVYTTDDLQRCKTEDGDPPPPLPDFPDPELVPPGIPLPETEYEISPPYEDRTENTEPFPGDEEDEPLDPEEDDIEPPIGNDCQRFFVDVIIVVGEESFDFSSIYFGPITGYGYQDGANPGSRTWGVYCRGNAFGGCQAPGFYNNGELANSNEGSVQFRGVRPID